MRNKLYFKNEFPYLAKHTPIFTGESGELPLLIIAFIADLFLLPIELLCSIKFLKEGQNDILSHPKGWSIQR